MITTLLAGNDSVEFHGAGLLALTLVVFAVVIGFVVTAVNK